MFFNSAFSDAKEAKRQVSCSVAFFSFAFVSSSWIAEALAYKRLNWISTAASYPRMMKPELD
jgi:hypothetical protein